MRERCHDAMALSLSLWEGVVDLWENHSKIDCISSNMATQRLEPATGGLYRQEAMSAAVVAEQGEGIRPTVGTSLTCARTWTVDFEFFWEKVWPRVPPAHALTPTESVYVGWTAKSQQGRLWVTHRSIPQTGGQHLHFSLISRIVAPKYNSDMWL